MSRYPMGGATKAEYERHRDLWRVFPRMVHVLPPGKSGAVEIYHFDVSRKRAEVDRYVRNELWTPGRYVQLKIDGVGWMFDSLHERCMNRTAVDLATGDVLIAGLGIGMILWPILAKPEVRSVTVLENSDDVARLVLPSLDRAIGREKLSLVMADAKAWEPAPGRLFDYVWLDCVPGYGYTSGMLSVQEGWLKRYRPFCRSKTAFAVDHWGYQECLVHLLDDQAQKKHRGYPIGPPDEMAAALAQAYGLTSGIQSVLPDDVNVWVN